MIIAEHSVDLDLLPERANILDIGCRGFGFTDKMRELGHNVYPVDIDLFLGQEENYDRCAITGETGWVGVEKNADPQATRIKLGNEVRSYTIASYSEKTIKGLWDLIKMDVEGSEYEIIMTLEKPPARQLSIEFHLHTGIYKLFEMNMMENKLRALGYKFTQHYYETRHGAGFNYWDSLFILPKWQ